MSLDTDQGGNRCPTCLVVSYRSTTNALHFSWSVRWPSCITYCSSWLHSSSSCCPGSAFSLNLSGFLFSFSPSGVCYRNCVRAYDWILFRLYDWSIKAPFCHSCVHIFLLYFSEQASVTHNLRHGHFWNLFFFYRLCGMRIWSFIVSVVLQHYPPYRTNST